MVEDKSINLELLDTLGNSINMSVVAYLKSYLFCLQLKTVTTDFDHFATQKQQVLCCNSTATC